MGKSEETATFRSEIEIMRTYLELQQMRHDFEVQLDMKEGAYLDSPVARFILQPIVENAVCHGLDDNGKLEIRVSSDETAQMVRIVIRDDGKGLSQETLALLSATRRINSRRAGASDFDMFDPCWNHFMAIKPVWV